MCSSLPLVLLSLIKRIKNIFHLLTSVKPLSLVAPMAGVAGEACGCQSCLKSSLAGSLWPREFFPLWLAVAKILPPLTFILENTL